MCLLHARTTFKFGSKVSTVVWLQVLLSVPELTYRMWLIGLDPPALVLVIDFRVNAPVTDTLKPNCRLLRVYSSASGVLSTVIQLETQECD